jgi:pimeloyl-ACP methyl ester carboxylesterase
VWRHPVIVGLLVLIGLGGCNPAGGPSSATTPGSQVPTPSPAYTLVNVGRQATAIDCRGLGTPTVVLISGLGVLAETWAGLIDEVARETRVCRYDRPGLGESEFGEGARTAELAVAHLRTLLEAAGEEPPYVLAGASLGGLYAQLHARSHPQDVRGVVFVDAIHPDFDARIEPLLTDEQVDLRREELGLNQERIAFEDIVASESQVNEAPSFPDVPVAVLRHGIPFDAADDWPAAEVEALWEDLQAALAALGAGGPLTVAELSGHRIAEQQPDLVVQAIRDVIGRSR